MSGHSKWSSIKHKKGAADAKRGKLFTKLARAITIAARDGGGEPDNNPPLALAIQKARGNSMPKDNIQRAIDRGTGEGSDAAAIENVLYEGYGPGGVAMMISTLTDNKNRTVGEIRFILGKWNGNLAAENSVAWMFSRKGQLVIEKGAIDEDKLLSAALDAGADPDGLAFDQRGDGFPRVVGTAADIGAYEVQSPQDIIFADGFDR